MPFHLPAISRRDFLKGTLATGASAFFSGSLFAADKSADPHTWALLSDTHIDADRELVARGTNMTANLTAAVRDVLALEQRPGAALVNGDCAYLKGEPGDYAAFGELVEPIRAGQIPLHLTLGNHDARDTFREALAAAKEAPSALPDRYVSIVAGERANWFLLDTLDQTNKTPGLLGEAQLAWLAKALDERADKPAIIVAHHDLADGRSKGSLIDTAAIVEVLAPRKHVKAYIYGHTHNWHTTTHESGIHLINLPPVAYPFGEGKPSGWVLATVQPDGVKLKLSTIDKAHAQNGEVVDLKWRA